MTTCVYETIPQQAGEQPRYFEFKQRMSDAPLTKHPETGEPSRRVLLGGFGVLNSKPAAQGNGSACGCGPGGCCH